MVVSDSRCFGVNPPVTRSGGAWEPVDLPDLGDEYLPDGWSDAGQLLARDVP